MTYEVKRLGELMTIDGDWDKAQWQNVQPLKLTHYMGDKPAHFPEVQAKLQYDDEAIYVIFRVKDRYVRAAAARHQDPVCKDSCVELFFTPGTDVSKGYFNLEMNCGGTMLFHYQLVPRENPVPIAEEDLARLEVAHNMPKRVDPEIAEPTTWTVEYRLPLDTLRKYFPDLPAKPSSGVTWRANVYKCADATSHPHWLTWSVVEFERPDFHMPNFFGTFVFE
jgi:hypothetical protein